MKVLAEQVIPNEFSGNKTPLWKNTSQVTAVQIRRSC
ncbi:MAG: hypothetical protein QOJ99_5561, partial [Bryobacterales bacterium]|nr:hypothetical protein [Bryobacterales bacterium]